MAKKMKRNKSSEFGRVQLPKGKTANERAKDRVADASDLTRRDSSWPGEKDKNVFARVASRAVREARENEGKNICQNCRKTFTEDKLAEITHGIWERVSPGEIMPSGECPSCGALCHPVVKSASPNLLQAVETILKNTQGASGDSALVNLDEIEALRKAFNPF
jgi:hypothetical protein